MYRKTSAGAALLALLVLSGSAVSPALAQGQDKTKPAQSCFYSRNISGWAPVDRSTINIRVTVNDVYQLKLLGDCPNLDWVNAIGLEHRGSNWICAGWDAEIIAPQPGRIPPQHCPVTSIRKLSKEEAKALPPRQHP
jgi:hypothetical protein